MCRSLAALSIALAACVPDRAAPNRPDDSGITVADAQGEDAALEEDTGAAPEDAALDAGLAEDAAPPDSGMDAGLLADTGVDAGQPAGSLRILRDGRPAASIDFGGVPVGRTSTLTLMLENGSDTTVELTGMPQLVLEGPAAARFTVISGAIAPLAPGARATFELRYTPQALGASEATLSIPNDRFAGFEVPIRGRGGIDPLFVAVGSSLRRTSSPDGITWQNDVQGGGAGGEADLFRAIAYGDNLFVAVGGSAGAGLIYTTTDGAVWENRSDNVNWLGGVAYGNGWWVAAGSQGRTVRSRDGVSWSPTVTGGNSIRAMAFGAGVFVAVGDGGRRATSPDGASWPNDISGGADLIAITYAQGQFVATGLSGRRVVSADGITWTNDVTGGSPLSGIAYGNGRWVAVGNGVVQISPDARMWTSSFTTQINRIVFGNGIFVGSGSGDRRFTSTDGLSWTERAGDGRADYRGIAYGD